MNHEQGLFCAPAFAKGHVVVLDNGKLAVWQSDAAGHRRAIKREQARQELLGRIPAMREEQRLTDLEREAFGGSELQARMARKVLEDKAYRDARAASLAQGRRRMQNGRMETVSAEFRTESGDPLDIGEVTTTREFALEPYTRLPMDGSEVTAPRRAGEPPVKRTLPYMEVLEFDPETGRGLANLDGSLVTFEGRYVPHAWSGWDDA